MTRAVRRLVSGSVLRVVSLASGILVSFYLMPFLVHTLGDRWYGFWVLAGTIVGYYTLLDLGLTNAAHRFLAVTHAQKDPAETSRVFVTALVLFTLGGVLALGVTVVLWAAAPWFVQPVELATIRQLILLLGLNFAIGFPVAVFHGVLATTLRYDLSSYLQLARLAMRTALVVMFVGETRSVLVLALVTLVTDVAGNIATAIVALRLWPWLQLSWRHFDRARVRPMLGFGVYAFAIRVADLVRYGVDSLVVAAFLGMAAVTHYSIAMRLTDYFQDLLNQALGVLTPVFSLYHGSNEAAALVERVRQASRFAVAASSTVAGAAIIFGAPFIARWMGRDYLDAYWPLVILVCAALLSVMQLPSLSYLFALGRHGYYAGLNGVDAVVNLALSLLLARRYGMVGIALGTAISAAIVKLVFQPRYVCRLLGIPVRLYWTELGEVLLSTLALQIPIYAIARIVDPRTYAGLFTLAAGCYALHAAALFLFVLQPQDRAVLTDALPALGRLLPVRARILAVFPLRRST